MYAFVHIEKTAGTTMNSILRRSFGTGHCDIRLPLAKRLVKYEPTDRYKVVETADLQRVKRIYRNLRGIAGHQVKVYSDLAQGYPDICFFTFLRDPVKRYCSHYLTRAGLPSSQVFDRWLASPWTHNWQTKMIAGECNAQKAIDLLATRFAFVGLVERFDESLLMFGQWLQEPDFRPEYRRLNQRVDNRGFREAVRDNQLADLSYLNSPQYAARSQKSEL